MDESYVDSDIESPDQTAQQSLAPTQNSHRLACVTCREKKIACDRVDPCSNCTKKGWKCEFPPRQRSIVKGQRIHITSVYEQKINNIEKQLQHVIGMLEPLASSSATWEATKERQRNQALPAPLSATTARERSPPPQSPKRKRARLIDRGNAHIAPEFIDGLTPPTRHTSSTPLSAFEGDSSLAAHTAMANDLVETAVNSTSLQGQMTDAMESLRQLVNTNGKVPDAYGMTSSQSPRLDSTPMLSGGNPHFESMGFHMFMTAKQFMEYLNRVYTPGESPTVADFIIVNGGLIDTFLRSILLSKDANVQRDFQQQMNHCEGNLEAALSRLPVHMPHTVDHIIALTYGVYQAIRSSQTSLAWTLVTTAFQMSVTAGFHRASSAKTDSRQETDQKAWLFWSLYSVEKGLSLRLGRPSSIPDYDITVPLPQHDGPDISAYSSCFIRWIRLSRVQGKIYKMLYSPLSLAGPSTKRVAWARSLAEETKTIYKNVDGVGASEPARASNNNWTTSSGTKTELAFFSESVLYYSALTLILKALPPDEGSTSHFASECITTARTALEKHHEYCNAIGPDNGRHIDIYVNWTVLYNPFVPFIVIFCHVIESGDRQDLGRLQEFVASLDSARKYSQATANIHRQFQVLCNVARQFTEMRASNELLDNDTITDFDEYIQALGIFPSRITGDESLGVLPWTEVVDMEPGGW
ncbi:hypothetical protein ACJZ2D_003757 [Fusarium nematophilum]